MKKFTNLQKEVFKRLVLDCILQRLTTEEALEYINPKLKAKYDIEIGGDYFRHVKMDLRRDSQKELDHLRKNRLSYMNQLFIERADEIKAMQRKLWEIITYNQEDKPDVAIRSISELHKISQSLSQMYEMLPFLGHLPSDAFTGIDSDDSNITTMPKPLSRLTPPSDIGGGGSGGMYRIKHSANLDSSTNTVDNNNIA
jgi:hypothetical protein